MEAIQEYLKTEIREKKVVKSFAYFNPVLYS